jgi:TonB dependent receptor
VQYTQALPRIGLSDVERFYPNSLWLTAGAALPPLTTDLYTAGVERWLGHDWLAAANGYARRTSGVATQDPTPGATIDRPLFVAARGAAHGVDLSLRRLAGRTTGSLGYSYGVSTLDAAGFHYFAPQDRTHSVDLTLSHRFSPRWRLAAAFSAATGAPFTHTQFTALPARGDSSRVDVTYLYGAPGEGRRPPAYLLGTEAEWTHHFSHWQLGAYAQVQSALANQSTGSYRGDGCGLNPSGARECYSTPRESTFWALPTLGLRFAF